MLSPNHPSLPVSGRRLNRAHHHRPAQQNPGGPCAERDSPSRAKRVPQAFKNPRVRDQTGKKKSSKASLPSESAFWKCSQSLACPQGWDPKELHPKPQSLALSASDVCSPNASCRLLPVPPRHASGSLQSTRPQLQHPEPPRPAACHAVPSSEHCLLLAPRAPLAAARCTK